MGLINKKVNTKKANFKKRAAVVVGTAFIGASSLFGLIGCKNVEVDNAQLPDSSVSNSLDQDLYSELMESIENLQNQLNETNSNLNETNQKVDKLQDSYLRMLIKISELTVKYEELNEKISSSAAVEEVNNLKLEINSILSEITVIKAEINHNTNVDSEKMAEMDAIVSKLLLKNSAKDIKSNYHYVEIDKYNDNNKVNTIMLYSNNKGNKAGLTKDASKFIIEDNIMFEQNAEGEEFVKYSNSVDYLSFVDDLNNYVIYSEENKIILTNKASEYECSRIEVKLDENLNIAHYSEFNLNNNLTSTYYIIKNDLDYDVLYNKLSDEIESYKTYSTLKNSFSISYANSNYIAINAEGETFNKTPIDGKMAFSKSSGAGYLSAMVGESNLKEGWIYQNKSNSCAVYAYQDGKIEIGENDIVFDASNANATTFYINSLWKAISEYAMPTATEVYFDETNNYYVVKSEGVQYKITLDENGVLDKLVAEQTKSEYLTDNDIAYQCLDFEEISKQEFEEFYNLAYSKVEEYKQIIEQENSSELSL